MTNVVDRANAAVEEQAKVRRAEARRVLIILTVFMLIALLANFWL